MQQRPGPPVWRESAEKAGRALCLLDWTLVKPFLSSLLLFL